MQARPTPRIRCSSVLLLLGLLLTFLLFLFYFLFISPNSQPSSLREKGPFASLACLPTSAATDLIPCHSVVSFFLYFFPAFKPIHRVGWVIFFWACLKTERLRWGSPTATAPFALFWLSNLCEILVLFLLPCLCFCFFRVLPCPSVANASSCF